MLNQKDREFIQSAAPNTVVPIRFLPQPDLFLLFTVDTDPETQRLQGLTLNGLRHSRGPVPYALKEDLVPTIFQPELKAKSPTEWLLSIQPLTEPLTLFRRRGGGFGLLYPFRDQGKVGQVTDIAVDYTIHPRTMKFIVHATHRPSKDAEPVELETSIDCPAVFVQRLYDYLVN